MTLPSVHSDWWKEEGSVHYGVSPVCPSMEWMPATVETVFLAKSEFHPSFKMNLAIEYTLLYFSILTPEESSNVAGYKCFIKQRWQKCHHYMDWDLFFFFLKTFHSSLVNKFNAVFDQEFIVIKIAPSYSGIQCGIPLTEDQNGLLLDRVSAKVVFMPSDEFWRAKKSNW